MHRNKGCSMLTLILTKSIDKGDYKNNNNHAQ